MKSIALYIILFLFLTSCGTGEVKQNISVIEKKESFYANGKIERVAFYRDSIIDSLYIHYDFDGSIDTTGFYRDGEKDGKWKEFGMVGVIQRVKHYTTYDYGEVKEYVDSLWIIKSIHPLPYLLSVRHEIYDTPDSTREWTTEFFYNGKVSRQFYSDLMADSEKLWDSTGYLAEKNIFDHRINYKSDEQSFYPNGALKEELISTNGLTWYIIKKYDENGKLTSEKKIDRNKTQTQK